MEFKTQRKPNIKARTQARPVLPRHLCSWSRAPAKVKVQPEHQFLRPRTLHENPSIQASLVRTPEHLTPAPLPSDHCYMLPKRGSTQTVISQNRVVSRHTGRGAHLSIGAHLQAHSPKKGLECQLFYYRNILICSTIFLSKLHVLGVGVSPAERFAGRKVILQPKLTHHQDHCRIFSETVIIDAE